MLPVRLRYGVLAFFRNTSGLPGLGLRYACVHSLARECGDNVFIGSHSFLTHLENCSLGSNISIREMCVVGAKGGLRIGDNVAIAHGCSVMTEEHDYELADVLMRDAPVIGKPTVIEENAWIGAGARITAGVTIGRGAVVGAGSVVTKPVPPDSVAVGVPARVIRHRRPSEPRVRDQPIE